MADINKKPRKNTGAIRMVFINSACQSPPYYSITAIFLTACKLKLGAI